MAYLGKTTPRSLLMPKFRRRRNALSLVELLVTVSIVGVLVSIATINYRDYQKKARDTARIASLKKIELALISYYHDNGIFPESSRPGACPFPTDEECLIELRPYLDVRDLDSLVWEANGVSTFHYATYYNRSLPVIQTYTELPRGSACTFPNGGWCSASTTASRNSWCLCPFGPP